MERLDCLKHCKGACCQNNEIKFADWEAEILMGDGTILTEIPNSREPNCISSYTLSGKCSKLNWRGRCIMFGINDRPIACNVNNPREVFCLHAGKIDSHLVKKFIEGLDIGY